MKNVILALTLLLLASACSTMPETPAQGVYTAKTDFAAALIVAVQYKSLPDCIQGSVRLCKKGSVVKVVLRAAEGSKILLDNAEEAVRNPDIDSGSAVQARIAAVQAVKTFVELTNKLEVR